MKGLVAWHFDALPDRQRHACSGPDGQMSEIRKRLTYRAKHRAIECVT